MASLKQAGSRKANDCQLLKDKGFEKSDKYLYIHVYIYVCVYIYVHNSCL